MTDALARASDPETSHAAAASVPITRLEQRVLEALRKFGAHGQTTHDLARTTGLDLVTVSPRMKPLATKGLVVDSGARRPSPSGRQGIVWRAA